MVTLEEARDVSREKFVCPSCGHSDTDELGTVTEGGETRLYVYCHECDAEFAVGFDPAAA